MILIITLQSAIDSEFESDEILQAAIVFIPLLLLLNLKDIVPGAFNIRISGIGGTLIILYGLSQILFSIFPGDMHYPMLWVLGGFLIFVQGYFLIIASVEGARVVSHDEGQVMKFGEESESEACGEEEDGAAMVTGEPKKEGKAPEPESVVKGKEEKEEKEGDTVVSGEETETFRKGEGGAATSKGEEEHVEGDKPLPEREGEESTAADQPAPEGPEMRTLGTTILPDLITSSCMGAGLFIIISIVSLIPDLSFQGLTLVLIPLWSIFALMLIFISYLKDEEERIIPILLSSIFVLIGFLFFFAAGIFVSLEKYIEAVMEVLVGIIILRSSIHYLTLRKGNLIFTTLFVLVGMLSMYELYSNI